MNPHSTAPPTLAKRWYDFLAPKHWGTWLLLGLMWLLSLLPYPIMLRLGSAIGWLLRIAVPKRRRITEINIALCFPELSAQERNVLLKRNYRSLGIGLFETTLAWFASDKRLQKLVIIEGKENIPDFKRLDGGILLMACHYTHIELGIRLLSMITPLNVMYRPQNNKLFEWALQKARRHYVQRGIVKQDVRALIRSLQNHEVVCYTPDHDIGRRASVFAPFFGVMACSVTATSRFVKKTHSCVAPGVFYHRDEVRRKYILQAKPPLDNFPTDDDLADATRVNAIIEEAIRQHPEQYMWQHRRFKTRPEGEEAFY